MQWGCILFGKERTLNDFRENASSRRSADDTAEDFPARLERATRGLLELNVEVLEVMERKVGLAPLRALQSLDRQGPDGGRTRR